MKPRMPTRAPVYMHLPLVLAVGACGSSDPGETTAAATTAASESETGAPSSASSDTGEATTSGSETGDMVVAPAECGDDNVAAGAKPALARWPYVQNVTSDAAIVAWGVVAPEGATPESAAPSELRWGRDPAHDGRADAFSAQVIPAMPDGSDMLLYAARATGLEPDTDYCYKVVTDGEELAGGFRFRTAPATEDAVVRFAAIGDWGAGTEEQARVLEQIESWRAQEGLDLLLTTGDNAYGDGTHVEWQTNVFEPYRALLAEVPMYAVIGNHDDKTDDARPELDNLFVPAQALNEQDQERYYSIEWGPLHFVGLDTERALDDMLPGLLNPEFKDPTQQDAWFRGDMEANTRPWKIVSFHQPTFSNTEGRSPEMRMREAFVPMFEEFGVQLVLQGHNHLYERYHPIRELQLTTTEGGGVVYVTTGGGGKSLYDEDTDSDPWQVTFKETYHFVYGVIEGCTLTLSAVDLNGEIFDESVIVRC